MYCIGVPNLEEQTSNFSFEALKIWKYFEIQICQTWKKCVHWSIIFRRHRTNGILYHVLNLAGKIKYKKNIH